MENEYLGKTVCSGKCNSANEPALSIEALSGLLLWMDELSHLYHPTAGSRHLLLDSTKRCIILISSIQYEIDTITVKGILSVDLFTFSFGENSEGWNIIL